MTHGWRGRGGGRRGILVGLAVVTVVAACGDAPAVGPDAAADASADAAELPEDPFAHEFDSPEDFPRTGCRAGSLADLAPGVYPRFSLRLAREAGALVTYVSTFDDEEAVPHLLTADDLLVRRSSFNPRTGRWSLDVLHVCDQPRPGVLAGHRVNCFADRCGAPRAIESTRFGRRAGELQGDGLALLGELALPRPFAAVRPLNLRADGDVVYLAMGGGGLRVVSVADPRAPELLGHYQPATANHFNDVKLLRAGGRRYAVLAGAPSTVVDVTVPPSPQLVAELPVSAHTLAIEGTMAYFVDGLTTTLSIVDLADPRAPVERAVWTAPSSGFLGFHDLHVRGGVAYISTFYAGLTIVDVSEPTAARLLGASPEDPDSHYWHSPWALDVGGRRLALNGNEGEPPLLRVLDADPASPTFLGTVGAWSLGGEVSMHNVMARGTIAYLVHYQEGVRVLDLADPAAPRMIGYFNTWREQDAIAAYFTGAIGLDLDPARRRIYVADTQRGLLVLEASAALMPP